MVCHGQGRLEQRRRVLCAFLARYQATRVQLGVERGETLRDLSLRGLSRDAVQHVHAWEQHDRSVRLPP